MLTSAQCVLEAFLRRAREPGRVISTVSELHDRMRHRAPRRVVTVNLFELHHYVRDPHHRFLTDAADYWTADGWPVVRALRKIGVSAERVTGSGLCSDLLTTDPVSGLRHVAVLGSSDQVVDEYARRLTERGRSVVLRDTGRRDDWTATRMKDRLMASRADVVLVAVGTPYGVDVAARVQGFAPCPVIAVGAGVGMAVGMERRAPRPVQDVHLEWAWRMLADPRRLARRYAADCAPLLPALSRAAASVA